MSLCRDVKSLMKRTDVLEGKEVVVSICEMMNDVWKEIFSANENEFFVDHRSRFLSFSNWLNSMGRRSRFLLDYESSAMNQFDLDTSKQK